MKSLGVGTRACSVVAHHRRSLELEIDVAVAAQIDDDPFERAHLTRPPNARATDPGSR